MKAALESGEGEEEQEDVEGEEDGEEEEVDMEYDYNAVTPPESPLEIRLPAEGEGSSVEYDDDNRDVDQAMIESMDSSGDVDGSALYGHLDITGSSEGGHDYSREAVDDGEL